jgi:small-conductance mechanosensitive channel
MHNPYLAILAAAVAAWVFGSVWYNVFANAWLAALGNDPAQIEAKRKVRQVPYVPMAVSFASEIALAALLSFLLSGLGLGGLAAGALAGLVIGAFMVLCGLVNNIFAGRTLRLSLIDGVHWIGVAVIECVVLTALS